VLIYGHYDVQPPEPLELWKTPPFEPRIEGGKIFARGASDDKGQTFAHLNAIEAFLKTRGALPVNVKVLIEGEEEIGSPKFTPFVEAQSELLACDCVAISDTSMWAEGAPALCYALRGLVAAEVEIEGPCRDLHSGSFGGAVPNPITLLCQILGRLHDADNRIAVPGFYDDALPTEDWEREEFAKLGFDETEYCEDLGLKALHGEAGYGAMERLWTRPTLDLNGIQGGYQGSGTKTVIPSKASAKLTMRIVPRQDPNRILDCLERYLRSLCPPSVKMNFTRQGGGPAVLLPTSGPIVEAAKTAFLRGFGREPIMIREGASIPIVSVFTQALGAPCVLLGLGLPDDNLHSPNEKFNLDCFHRGMKTSAWFLETMGGKG